MDHAPVAYATSVLASKRISLSLLPAVEGDNLQRAALPPQSLAALSRVLGDETTEEALAGLQQRQLSARVDTRMKEILLEGIGDDEEREKARIGSVALPHAGDWLNVAPITALGLHLRSREFVLVARYRLGLQVFDNAAPCPACLRLSDDLGDHALSCGFGGERISRHNQLRDALFDTAVAAGLGPVKEGRFLLPGQDRRPADVLLPYWNGGKDAALDVTVVNPLQRATLPQAAINPGHALQFAFERKINGAAEDCRREGIDFVPLAVESFGGWHQVATREVEKMGRALARHTGEEEGEAVRHLWGRLGILLQRGNAAILGNRVPAFPPPHIDGIA